MAGLIVFGKAPRVEVPPAPSELNLPMGIESTIDPRTPTRAPPSSCAGGVPRGHGAAGGRHLRRQ